MSYKETTGGLNLKKTHSIGIILNLLLKLFFIVLFLLPSFAFQRFHQYNTELYINPPLIRITKNIEIENYGNVGIVPGEMIFRILNINESQIINISAKDEYGNIFPTKVVPSENFVELVVENYIPIFAQSKQKVFIEYTLLIKTSSLLFYSFEYPLIDTTIPIKEGKIYIKLPNNLHLTYAPNVICESKNNCYFEIKNQKNKMIEFEVSKLPLPLLKVRASNLFWYGLISALILVTIIQIVVRKLLRKI